MKENRELVTESELKELEQALQNETYTASKINDNSYEKQGLNRLLTSLGAENPHKKIVDEDISEGDLNKIVKDLDAKEAKNKQPENVIDLSGADISADSALSDLLDDLKEESQVAAKIKGDENVSLNVKVTGPRLKH